MTKNLISLGAGVQSSVLALMASRGEISPMPDAAIFADTKAEPQSVYRWLDWLEKQLAFPVIRVTRGSLETESLKMRTSKKGKKYSVTNIPFFVKTPDGVVGKIPARSCTAEFKIRPLIAEARAIAGKDAMSDWRRLHRQELRELAAYKRNAIESRRNKQPLPKYPQSAWDACQSDPLVVQWIGISRDEIQRAKPSRDPWILSRWPLLELRMTRAMCLEWMQRNGFPEPPRSSCVFCPFHNQAEWRRMQVEEPEEFSRAVEFEKRAQQAKECSDNMSSVPYLHRSGIPLDQIDFRSDVERGQRLLWDDECTGFCGN